MGYGICLYTYKCTYIMICVPGQCSFAGIKAPTCTYIVCTKLQDFWRVTATKFKAVLSLTSRDIFVCIKGGTMPLYRSLVTSLQFIKCRCAHLHVLRMLRYNVHVHVELVLQQLSIVPFPFIFCQLLESYIQLTLKWSNFYCH